METLANNKNKTINAENATFFCTIPKVQWQLHNNQINEISKIDKPYSNLKTFNVVYEVYVQYFLDNKKFA